VLFSYIFFGLFVLLVMLQAPRHITLRIKFLVGFASQEGRGKRKNYRVFFNIFATFEISSQRLKTND